MTIALPAASAGPIFTADRKSCEFQGTIAAITPRGSRLVKTNKSGLSIGRVSPVILSAAPAEKMEKRWRCISPAIAFLRIIYRYRGFQFARVLRNFPRLNRPNGATRDRARLASLSPNRPWSWRCGRRSRLCPRPLRSPVGYAPKPAPWRGLCWGKFHLIRWVSKHRLISILWGVMVFVTIFSFYIIGVYDVFII